MAVPGTTFNWIDQSQIPDLPSITQVADTSKCPLFLSCISADRGPEDLRIVYGQEFYELYGTDIQFRKHGQPLLNAAAAINNGAKLMVQRIVADDATLANSIVVANVKVVSTQKTDADGNNLYLNDDGEETTEVTTTPAVNETAEVSFETYSIADVNNTNIKSLDEAVASIAAPEGEEDDFGDVIYRYPLFAVAETGRGPSVKRFRIVPDYANSKKQDYMFYDFLLYYDTNNNYESTRFCADPDVIFSDISMNLSAAVKRDLKQANAKFYDEYVTEYVEKLSEVTGIDAAELKYMDIFFGKTRKGTDIEGIVVNPISDEATVDLNALEGVTLEEGSHGSFGDAPYGTEEYYAKVLSFFDGSLNDEIYNLDNYRIDACMDANYPSNIKRAIEELADYRQDFLFFGDLGYLTTMEEIEEEFNKVKKSKFNTYLSTAYDVMDPFTKKQITVTYTYDMTISLCNHFLSVNPVTTPLAGSRNGFVFNNAIEGTINFYPKTTPKLKQKEQFDEMKLNYATYLDGALTVESLYTTQEDYTQLSFSNNVLGIQQVAKAVRRRCPALRFSFISGNDLEEYKKAVENVLEDYKDNFEELEFVYVQDPVMKANKIFKASLKFRFKDFVQSEIFDLYALS